MGQPFPLSRMHVLVGRDEVQKRARFINQSQPDAWLIGLSYQSDVLDMAGTLVSSARTYFDGPDFEGLPLGQATAGKAMREEVWLKDESGERWFLRSATATTRMAWRWR